MIKQINSITLSLSGICQSVYLVKQLSEFGKCDNDAYATCVKSILIINPIYMMEIYGKDEKNLYLGLKTLVSILTLSNFSNSHIELMKYISDIIIIEKKLKKNYEAMNSLEKKILMISKEYNISYDIDLLTNRLAQIYVKIISVLDFRIEVRGVKNFLQNFKIQEKIRCLLFGGIRSVVLWRQFGGNQFKLIFFRCCIIRHAKKILFHLNKRI